MDHRSPAHSPYDRGDGFLRPGLTRVRNTSGRPERVLTERELRERTDGEPS